MEKFFISYNKEDKSWAEWISWQLVEAGYDVFIQAWDIRPGNNFVLAMQKATETCNHTIAVLSSHYIVAKYTQPEWAAAFNQDPTGEERLLLPVRIEEIKLSGLWLSIVYIDLVGLGEEDARKALLEGIALNSRFPKLQPNFPGKKQEITHFDSTFPIKSAFKSDPLKEWTVLSFEIQEENGNKALASLIRQQHSRVVEANTIVYNNYSMALQLLDSHQEGHENDLNFYKAIFEIVFPLSYKDKLSFPQKIHLRLDTKTVRMPWELIIISAILYKNSSILGNLNIIRELSTPAKRLWKKQRNKSEDNFALIIGGAQNPSFPVNPSSINEGVALSDLLQNYGYTVAGNFFSNAANIISSFFKHDYKIIHISGTGYFDNDNSIGGILIGENIILSPTEFDQIVSPPDLVFINFGTQQLADCKNSDEMSRDSDYYTLAANIATQLLEIGIKCIVVSSLPIDEVSNVTFTIEFYKALLEGEKFSDAVKKARIKSVGDTQNLRIIGGFQCYGDIDFILSISKKDSLDDASVN